LHYQKDKPAFRPDDVPEEQKPVLKEPTSSNTKKSNSLRENFQNHSNLKRHMRRMSLCNLHFKKEVMETSSPIPSPSPSHKRAKLIKETFTRKRSKKDQTSETQTADIDVQQLT
jgi:hypothetical protein